jgi:putative membrane protein
MKRSLKALTLIGLAFFLYSRLYNGTLFFYINRRFAWLTLLAAIGLLLISASYQYRPTRPHIHEDAGHHHAISWGGLLVVILPVVLGLIVPPKPLGTSAMANRGVSVGSMASAASSGSGTVLVTTDEGDRTVLDWVIAFGENPDPAAFVGQEAHVVGFVYRDGRFDADTFMAGRFVVTCCVADATAVGLIVHWPEASSLAQDQWVEVSGHFEPGEFDGQQVPILVADTIIPTEPPNQPYLY